MAVENYCCDKRKLFFKMYKCKHKTEASLRIRNVFTFKFYL